MYAGKKREFSDRDGDVAPLAVLSNKKRSGNPVSDAEGVCDALSVMLIVCEAEKLRDEVPDDVGEMLWDSVRLLEDVGDCVSVTACVDVNS